VNIAAASGTLISFYFDIIGQS